MNNNNLLVWLLDVIKLACHTETHNVEYAKEE